MQLVREARMEATLGVGCFVVQTLSNCDSLGHVCVAVGEGEGEGEGEGCGAGACPDSPPPPQAVKARVAAKAKVAARLNNDRNSIVSVTSRRGARFPLAAFMYEIP